MTWILLCLIASFIQTLRNSNQKLLKNTLPTEMVVWSRFLFAVPFALIYILFLNLLGIDIPITNLNFWTYVLIASICQISGNLLLVNLFSRRNFATGITYSKTEALASALFGMALFQEYISFFGFLSIILGLIGIFTISVIESNINPLKLFKGALNKSMFIGIGCGTLYALGGVFIRQASISLESNNILSSAALTLLVMVTFQAIILGIWIFYKYNNVLTLLNSSLIRCVKVGLYGTIASIGWFTAFTMTISAYVTLVSQTEILFSILISYKTFKEKLNTAEIFGICILLISICLLIFV